jgi:hypothetical protein
MEPLLGDFNIAKVPNGKWDTLPHRKAGHGVRISLAHQVKSGTDCKELSENLCTNTINFYFLCLT